MDTINIEDDCICDFMGTGEVAAYEPAQRADSRCLRSGKAKAV